MPTTVICPNCSTSFEPTAAIAQSVREEMKNEFNQKWKEEMKQRDDQFKLKEKQYLQQEADLKNKLEQEKRELSNELSKQLTAKIHTDFEHKLKMLEDANKEGDAKLKESRQKELEFLKKMQELKTKEQELEIEMQRKMMEERGKLSEIVKREEEEKTKLRDAEHNMKIKELEKQLDDQRKLAEEMKRKAEQGSMQLQGEVQELALEELLRSSFPFDLVSEVGKGVKGADCVLTIRNKFGQECGKIIFESKRTKDFSNEWIEKLKKDQRTQAVDVAVLVTQAMPKGMDCFGEKDGIWICTFAEVQPLVHVLRDLVTKVYNASKNQENKGDKMTMLYNYLISHEFSEQWRAIREGFHSMKTSIQRERDQMEKLWKAREKQLEKVLLNAAGIQGSIEGIAGMDVDLNLIEEDKGLMLE